MGDATESSPSTRTRPSRAESDAFDASSPAGDAPVTPAPVPAEKLRVHPCVAERGVAGDEGRARGKRGDARVSQLLRAEIRSRVFARGRRANDGRARVRGTGVAAASRVFGVRGEGVLRRARRGRARRGWRRLRRRVSIEATPAEFADEAAEHPRERVLARLLRGARARREARRARDCRIARTPLPFALAGPSPRARAPRVHREPPPGGCPCWR